MDSRLQYLVDSASTTNCVCVLSSHVRRGSKDDGLPMMEAADNIGAAIIDLHGDIIICDKMSIHLFMLMRCTCHSTS